jgi:hypothetical protein
MASEEIPVSSRFAMKLCPRCLTTLHVRKRRPNHKRHVVSTVIPHTKPSLARYLGRRCTLAWKRIAQATRLRQTSLVPPGFVIVTPSRRVSGLNAGLNTISSSRNPEVAGVSYTVRVHAEVLGQHHYDLSYS